MLYCNHFPPLPLLSFLLCLYRTAYDILDWVDRSVCSARQFTPMLFQSEPGEDLIFPRRPTELMLATATSCTWLAVECSWHRVWMWYYEALFIPSEVINTPWEPVLSCGFPLPSTISSRSQEPGAVARTSRGKVCLYIQVSMSLFELYHTFFSCWVDPQVFMCMHRYVCVSCLHAPVFCYA